MPDPFFFPARAAPPRIDCVAWRGVGLAACGRAMRRGPADDLFSYLELPSYDLSRRVLHEDNFGCF